VSPLRADAERNRSAILCAAAKVLGRQGLSAPLEDVAREAGVGIATLYRRFPSREALIEAVFDAQMAAYADRAEVAAERARTEPWPAFADHVRDVVRTQIEDPAFGAALLRPLQGSPLFARDHQRAFRATVLLVQRVRDAGVVRSDLHHSDLYLLLASASALVSEPGPFSGARGAERLTDLVLDALRTNVG
jgi:AcrR family transcriptional regulator